MKPKRLKQENTRLKNDSENDQPCFDNGRTSKSSICKLPDDCLINIFMRLSLVDRVRIQGVCKRWQAVSKMSWHRYNTLTLTSKDWGKHYSGKDSLLNFTVLKNVLKLCGNYITRVDLCDSLEHRAPTPWDHIAASKKLFTLIIKLCPNVTAIDLGTFSLTKQCIGFLAENYTCLEEFGTRNGCDLPKSICRLFMRNRNLRKIILRANYTTHCWTYLNSKAIEEIDFYVKKDDEGDIEYLCKYLRRYKNLKTFKIGHQFFTDNSFPICLFSVLSALAEHADSMKHLEIDFGMGKIVQVQPSHISCFENLEVLSLISRFSVWDSKEDMGYNVRFVDELFEAISTNCFKLTSIELVGLKNVTNAHLRCILSLPELQELKLSGMPRISDKLFTSGFALKKLDCSYCPDIQNSGLCDLVRASPSLESLRIKRCINVSINKVIEAAISGKKNRNDRLPQLSFE